MFVIPEITNDATGTLYDLDVLVRGNYSQLFLMRPRH